MIVLVQSLKQAIIITQVIPVDKPGHQKIQEQMREIIQHEIIMEIEIPGTGGDNV